jgi:hypothetical protein
MFGHCTGIFAPSFEIMACNRSGEMSCRGDFPGSEH